MQQSTPMSIARALTRRGRGASNDEPSSATSTVATSSFSSLLPTRAGTLRKTDYRSVDRAKISLPVTLLSTTNSLAYDAPDIPKIDTMALPLVGNSSMSPALSSASSRRSYEGSDSGASSATSISTPGLSREGSPVFESSQLNGFFPKKSFVDSPITPLSPASKEIEIGPLTPAVPNRALSHTKHNHQALASKRSTSRLSGESQLGPNSRSTSGELLSAPLEEHPFGAELAQVMEVAEEFGVKNVCIWDEEEQFLVDNGLGHFSADDYIKDIQPLFGKAFYESSMISNIPTWL